MASFPNSSSTSKKRLISLALLLLCVSWKIIAGEVMAQVRCTGTLGDCLWEQGEEMEMDSEANRRVLWATTQKRFISYEALKGDVVPCSRPGVPYYNCHALPTANPYTRGCGVISRCARDNNP